MGRHHSTGQQVKKASNEKGGKKKEIDRRRKGKDGGDDRGLGSIHELLNRSVERKERQFQFVKSSGNNPRPSNGPKDKYTPASTEALQQQNSIY